MSATYKIHPAIGVARLGTAQPSPEQQKNYYLAPTEEGALPTDPSDGQPVANFRDAEGKLLKQAAQFQVYAYEDGDPDGKPVVPGSGGIKAIEWTVYLANKKAAWYQFEQLTGSGMQPDPNLPADKGYLKNGPKVNPLRVNRQVADRQQLILDPGPRTVGGSKPASARFDLPEGPTTDPQKFKPNVIRELGSLYAEDQGTLLVFAGDGNSGTTNLNPAVKGQPAKYEYATTHYANNEGWFDDVADGPVHATLIIEVEEDGKPVEKRVEVDGSAWCLAAPPKYAPQIVNMVTLFDTIFDVAVRKQNYRPDLVKEKGGGFNSDYVVDFEREILPIISRPKRYKWTVDMAKQSLGPQHNADKGHQQILDTAWDTGAFLFNMDFVRDPGDINGDVGPLQKMPRLAGDAPFAASDPPSKFLTLTPTQYSFLRQWVNGPPSVAQTVPGRKVSAGEAIDHGVLKNCVGGAFCPGIEITWISRNEHIYSEPFRINAKKEVSQGKLNALNGDDNLYKDGVEPGDLSKYMAQPWQADFNECDNQGNVTGQDKYDGSDWWWWPAQRPYNVFPEGDVEQYADWTRGFHQASPEEPNLGDMQMVIDWKHLGFLKETDSRVVETERQTGQIDAYQDPLIPPPPIA